MSIEKNKEELELFSPEISARRVSGLMHYFKKERGLVEENPFLEILSGENVLKLLNDSSLWISQGLEEKIISYLSSAEDISPALYQIGKESFLSQAFDLLPTDNSAISILEFIPRIPVLLSKLTRSIRLDIINLEKNSAEFHFTYSHLAKEKWYDIIFFKGMLDGLSLLYELVDYSANLKETKLLGIHIHHKDLGENIKFGSEKNIFFIQWSKSATKVGRTQLSPNSISKADKTFVITRESENSQEEYSVLNLSSVINKSRELALENRDLEAAVEILKSFKTELEVKQKSIAKDLKLAKNIQKGIIPRTIPDWNGIQFWTYFNPMQEVSGDYYDYFPYNDSKLGIAVCDVSGHGVPAAFITALSKMLFNVYRSPQPSNIFKNVNRDLLELLQHQGYTTCIYAVIDDTYKITYSVAGHPRPILLRHKTSNAELLDGEGTFLGMFPEANDYYEDQSVQLEPGDKIFLYTDGITEAMNDDGEQFGEERLIQAILQTVGMSIQESIEHITSIYNEYTMGTDQSDDITIFGFSLSPDIDKFEELVNQGYLLYQEKKYSQATECFQSANKLMPRDMKNILHLSKSLAKEKKYSDAIDCLVNYNRYKMHDYESHFILGYCHFQEKEYEKAESELKKALYMDDSHPAVHYNLIRVYAKLGNTSKFTEALLKMKKLFPNFNRYTELNSLMD